MSILGLPGESANHVRLVGPPRAKVRHAVTGLRPNSADHAVLRQGDLGLTKNDAISGTMTMARLLFILPAIVPANQVLGAATDWVEVAPGAQLRAISSGTTSDGRALVGLELTLEPGLNTYWHVPGETGVPTMVSASTSSGAVPSEIRWPLPERDDSQGFVDYIYRDDLVLPILVTAPIDATLKLDVLMGICSDICVPVHAALDLRGDDGPDIANGLRLRQALAETPVPFTADDPPLTDISLDPDTGALSLGHDPTRIEPERIFPSFDGNAAVYSAPEMDASTGRLEFTLLVRKGDRSWQKSPLRLSFATPDGPYDILLPAVRR